MIKTFTGLTMAAALFSTVGGALAQQAGGGSQPQLGTAAPNAQNATPGREETLPPSPNVGGQRSGTIQQPTLGGGQGNNATSTEKK
jgi:hypothetical protein